MESPLTALDQAFEELYASLPELLGQAFVKEAGVQEGAPLLHQSQQRIVHELGIEISALRNRCRRGLQLILEHLHTATDVETAAAVHHLEKELSTKFQSVISSPSFTQIVLRVVSGDTWRESLRISREALDLLYSGARAIFENGRFQEAIECFTFLAWLDARQYDVWMALGHAQFHCAYHEGAISSYGIAAHCLPEESWPHIYSATCFEALGDVERATYCMKEGLRLEKSKFSPDQGLASALERKLEQYRQGTVTPIA